MTVDEALEGLEAVADAYGEALAVLEPVWQASHNKPRYIAKRVSVRLLELAESAPDALVGLALMRSRSAKAPEHALRSAIFAARIVIELELPRRLSMDAVVACLLHALGVDTHGAYANDNDAIAQRSLLTLLLSKHSDPGRYRQVLTAFQHRLRYDGTGSPKLEFPIRQHAFAALLAVANNFAELTAGIGTRDGKPATVPSALASLREADSGTFHPSLVKLLERAIGPVQIGTVARLDDDSTAVVVAYVPSPGGHWDALAVDFDEPSRHLILGSESEHKIVGLLDSGKALDWAKSS